MAAVTMVKPLLVSPKGTEEVQRGMATDTIAAGTPVVIDSAVAPGGRWDTSFKPAVSEAFFHGIAAKDAIANDTVEVIVIGEIDGYSGMTPGAPLYAESGAIGTTAPASAVRQCYAISATRIRISV